MQREGRRHLGIGEHLGMAAERGGGEAPQRLRHLQHDAPARLGEERDIAQELQRVAPTLLGMQQDGAPIEWLALPEWLREGAWRLHLAPPARFMLAPAFLEAAEREQHEGAIPAGIDHVRLEGDSLLIARKRFLDPPLILERGAEIVMRIRETGP